MIGILCSNGNEEAFSEKLHNLFKGTKKSTDDTIIVFTILNIDFLEKTVKGRLISGKVVEAATVTLPSVIFNFSVQHKYNCIKARKLLEDMEDVELINNVNRFDQSMVMEILSVSVTTIKYLLPYFIYDKSLEQCEIDEDKQYIEIPLKGTSISATQYKKTEVSSEKMIETSYEGEEHAQGLRKTVILQKKRILLEVPDLIMKNDQPVIIRTFVQRSQGRNWEILESKVIPDHEFIKEIPFEKINEASIGIISYINNYMPALGVCFIDLLMGSDGQIYFLRLGGIGEIFFELKQANDFYKRFYKNLIKLASYLKYV